MSAPQTEDDTRRRLNPLFNDNKLKLGLFGVNVSNGCAITTAEDRHTVSWPTNSGDRPNGGQVRIRGHGSGRTLARFRRRK